MTEQDIWNEFKKNGLVVVNYNGKSFSLTSLVFWSEPDNENFAVGYAEPRSGYGGICELFNIPDHELEAICPGIGIEWNCAEQTHAIASYDPVLMNKIRDIFVAYGCVDIS